MSKLRAALDAGATVMFTRDGAECTVTVTHAERRFTGHGENMPTALGRALAALAA